MKHEEIVSASRRLVQTTVLACLLLSGSLVSADPEDSADQRSESFDGFFLGVDIVSQNYFGGSRIGELDVLAREHKTVTDFSAGYRWQLAGGRLLVGLRINYGITEGDLRHVDGGRGLEILYENDSQLGVGGELGVVLGTRRNLALFLYGNEIEREFDVTISAPGGVFLQSDEQGLFRYGLGLEVRLRYGFHLRGTIGSGRAAFGGRVTNIDPDGRIDVGAGLLYQF